jgi:hypothetical protein
VSLRQVYGSCRLVLKLPRVEALLEQLPETLAAQVPALYSTEREADDGDPLVGVSAVAAGVTFGFAERP